MKYLFSISLSLLLNFTPTATAADLDDSSPFWQDVRELVVKCVVQPVTINRQGEKSYGLLRSKCPEVKTQGMKAAFKLHGLKHLATLSESQLSDGGDLFDVVVQDYQGNEVARRNNTPAFGDVLVALVGDISLLKSIPEEIVTDSSNLGAP